MEDFKYCKHYRLEIVMVAPDRFSISARRAPCTPTIAPTARSGTASSIVVSALNVANGTAGMESTKKTNAEKGFSLFIIEQKPWSKTYLTRMQRK